MKVLHLLVTLFVVSYHSSIAADSLLNTVRHISINLNDISSNILENLDRAQLAKYGNVKIQNEQDKRFQLLDRLKPIFNQIKQLESQYQHIQKSVLSVLPFVNRNVPFDFEVMANEADTVEDKYQTMIRYEESKYDYETDTLISFSRWAISTEFGSPSYLRKMMHQALQYNSSTLPDSSESDNSLSQLVMKFVEKDEMSHANQSAQQFIYNLFSQFEILDLKAFFLIKFGYTILRIFDQGNFTQDEQKLNSEYKDSYRTAEFYLRNAMSLADRSVWRSDPKVHIPNVTFDEVTRLLQGYIENEVDMDESGSCSKDCAAFDKAENRGCSNGFCEHQDKCSGELRNCRFIKSDMSVCQAPTNSHRRYNYIEYENGPLFGEYKSCESNITKVESWKRWFVECSYCFCLCDEQGLRSDRFFNLRETVADVKENKVVTGLRFVKKNRIFHLQIQQGKLLPHGEIETSSVDWKPVDAYNIYEENVVSGVDYHTMSYSSRSLDIDDNISRLIDADYVITGVRFRVLRSHLNLMVRFSKVDFDTGKLLDPEVSSEWKSKDIKDRQQLNLDELDLPTRTIAESKIISTPNHYLQFGNSGMHKDAAQTTVPFIDIQDVVSNPPVPLAGLGIYYKSRPGYGGFVAPKIITIDYWVRFGIFST